MAARAVDIAIIGAGPYGLSLAAHLGDSGQSVRVFGPPMRSWSHHMPRKMHLKSEGFASNLYDPEGKFPLKTYCTERGLPYADVGLPVAIETFIGYGLEFQRRYVPDLETVQITGLKKVDGQFELTASNGEVSRARRVVVAAGIINFSYLPPMLAAVPSSVLSHSSQHNNLTSFKGRKVAVLGAGASAVDIAALLMEAGADVVLIARRDKILFHDKPVEPRSLVQRLLAPRSGLGTGWRSRMCTDIPMVFHAMPESLRVRAVARHLGPAPCWFTRDAMDRLPMHLGATITDVQSGSGKAQISFRQADQTERQVKVDQVIAATGYKTELSRLAFIDQSIESQIRTVEGAPILNRQFESSLPGLFFIGVTAANSFGPLLRFAFGAGFAARRLAARLRGN